MEGSVLRFDLATGRESNRWRAHAEPYTVAFHPDNRQQAVGYSDAAVASVYDAADGRLVTDLPVGPVAGQVVAWHPDGQRLAVSGSDPRVQIWDVAAKRRLATLEGHAQQVTGLSFHPDGELLASSSWEGVHRLWHAASGRQLMQLPIAMHARFSRDGRWLGVAFPHGGQWQLVKVIPAREYRTLVSSLGAGQGVYLERDISPDGRPPVWWQSRSIERGVRPPRPGGPPARLTGRAVRRRSGRRRRIIRFFVLPGLPRGPAE